MASYMEVSMDLDNDNDEWKIKDLNKTLEAVVNPANSNDEVDVVGDDGMSSMQESAATMTQAEELKQQIRVDAKNAKKFDSLDLDAIAKKFANTCFIKKRPLVRTKTGNAELVPRPSTSQQAYPSARAIPLPLVRPILKTTKKARSVASGRRVTFRMQHKGL